MDLRSTAALVLPLLLTACGSSPTPPASPADAPPATGTPASSAAPDASGEAAPAPSAAASTSASAAPAASATAAAETPAGGSAKFCGKTVPVKFGLRKDGLFYFDVDVKERKEGCTGFTVELGDKIEPGKPFSKTSATAHFQKADGNADNASIAGTFTIVVKSFKPTTDWKKPGKCSGEVKASSTDKKHPAEITSEWEAECWVPKN